MKMCLGVLFLVRAIANLIHLLPEMYSLNTILEIGYNFSIACTGYIMLTMSAKQISEGIYLTYQRCESGSQEGSYP